MDIKRTQNIIILGILGVFTLGQLPGMFLQGLMQSSFRIHLLDLLAALLFITTISKKSLNIFMPLAVVCIFSLILSLISGLFDLRGILYLLRVFIYLGLFFAFPKRRLLPHLLVAVLAVAVYGWVQYALFPDLISLKYFGWDDHYFRLVSTLLDPAFAAIVFVLGCLVSVYFYVKTSKNLYFISLLFLLFTLGFTYSRASFLALLVGLFVLLWKKHKRLMLLAFVLLFLVIGLLPRSPGGEGVNLSRTNSVIQKIENFELGYKIFTRSPVFGVGYNNICRVKGEMGLETSGNACFGIDSSVLLILASTGVVGFFIFSQIFSSLADNIGSGLKGSLWKAAMVTVFVHSLFTNTLFYPWVLIFLAILTAEARAKKNRTA